MTNYPDRLLPAFHALSDPTRAAVVARLVEGPASAGDLARPFAMALPTFLQHLRVLESGGLILTRKEGRQRICRINVETLRLAEGWLAVQRRKWESQLDRLQLVAEALEAGMIPDPAQEHQRKE